MNPAGGDATDAANGLRGGARLDWSAGVSELTLQGDFFDNELTINETYSGIGTRVRGGNLLGRWVRPWADGEFQLLAYYDRFERVEPDTVEDNDTWDLSAQHTVVRGRHHLVLGAGYRSVRSRFVGPPGAAFLDPEDLTLTLSNVFVQDQIALTDALTLTLGAKYEANSFSGQEFLPNARLAWSRPGGDLVWAAVSRASRTPNRIERGLTLPGFLVGGDFQSETLTAWEAGYRAMPLPRASITISAFYNVYDELRTVSLHPVTVVPFTFTNHGAGEAWGVEAWGSYDVSDRWRISARGFNGYETSNKLLVMVDGRSLYSSLHSGVFWDARDLVLEDIERIEVISGPGGALYGANAVNGVINITTRSARDTVGTLVSVAAGTEDASVMVHHGAPRFSAVLLVFVFFMAFLLVLLFGVTPLLWAQ
ncbi:MAG: hypothetical protein CVT76_09760, partial [Alphaproteobacteria bacterium HGW-Alphaproteobacteria-15]